MNIKIEINEYDESKEQKLGVDIDIYHKERAKAKELAKQLLDAI